MGRELRRRKKPIWVELPKPRSSPKSLKEWVQGFDLGEWESTTVQRLEKTRDQIDQLVEELEEVLTPLTEDVKENMLQMFIEWLPEVLSEELDYPLPLQGEAGKAYFYLGEDITPQPIRVVFDLKHLVDCCCEDKEAKQWAEWFESAAERCRKGSETID